MDPADDRASQTDEFQSLTDPEFMPAHAWGTPSSRQHVAVSDNSGALSQRPDRGSRSQTTGSLVTMPHDANPTTTTESEFGGFTEFLSTGSEPLAGMSNLDEWMNIDAQLADTWLFPIRNDSGDATLSITAANNHLPEQRAVEADPSANVHTLGPQQAPQALDQDRPNKDRIGSSLPAPQIDSRITTTQPTGRTGPPHTAANSGPLSNPFRTLPQKGKRKRFSAEEREDTKRVRRVGACLRCKVMGEKCNNETPCKRCTEVSQSSRVCKGPCWRPSLDEVMTFRAGDSDQGQKRSELPLLEWCRDGDIRTVSLRFPFEDSGVESPLLTIQCRKFVPKPGTILSETFVVDGQPVELQLPPYACKYDTEATTACMAEFMEACQPALAEELLHSTTDELILLSIREAMRYSELHRDSSVHRALKIRVGAIMNSRYLALTDPRAFLPSSTERGNPYYFEGTPLPTMVSYVTQCLIAKQMIHEQNAILKDLKQKILKGNAKNKNWYEVFLTTLVLLGTVEYVYQKQKRYLGVKEGATSDSITNVKFISKEMLQEWEFSAQNLIVHFRCAMRGSIPFSLDWEPKSGNIERAGLGKEAIAYVKTVQRSLSQRREELSELRSEGMSNAFDKPLVWIGELFRFDDND